MSPSARSCSLILQPTGMKGNMDEPGNVVGNIMAGALAETVLYARAGEKIGSALVSLMAPLKTIKDVFELDPEFTPELAVAVEHIEQAAAALDRAGKFAEARFAARLANLINDPEGNTPT